jgi:peptidoglycan/LPS O-acetylase OafA/YrhL
MSTNISVSVVIYGIILVILSLVVRSMDPELARLGIITGIAGGAVCILLGILGWLGHRVRAWTILALIAVCYLLLSQVVISWGQPGGFREGLMLSVVLTLMFLASVGLVAYLAHFGSQYEGSRKLSEG